MIIDFAAESNFIDEDMTEAMNISLYTLKDCIVKALEAGWEVGEIVNAPFLHILH